MLAIIQGLMSLLNNAAGSNGTVSFVAASADQYIVNGTSISSPSTPAGVQTGDALLAVVMSRSTLTPPPGWSLIVSVTNTDVASQTLHLYRRTSATPSDSSTAFTWTQAVSGRMGLAYILARSSTGIFDVAASASVETDQAPSLATQTLNIPTLTSGANGELFVICAAATLSNAAPDVNTWVAPAGATIRTTPAASDNRIMVATQERDSGQSNASTTTYTTASAGSNYFTAIAARFVSLAAPLLGDPFFQNVVSLLHFNGADGGTSFVDQTGKTWTSGNATNARLSTTDPRFGSGCLLLTGASIFTADSADWDFGSGDFTIECWIRPANTSSTGAIVAQWDGGSGGRSWVVYQVGASFQFSYSVDGVNFINAFSAPAGWSTSAYQHIAVSCNSGVIRGFVNGVQVGTDHSRQGALFNSTLPLRLGDNHEGGTLYNGRIDDLRITKGVGRYPANFTPPTAPFPDTGIAADSFFQNVAALLHFDGANGSTTFTDVTGGAWTANGNVQLTSDGPRFGSASGTFDGASDFILSDTRASLGFATGDFTIEGWFKRGATGFPQCIYARGLLSGGFNQESISHAVFFETNNILNFRIYNGSAGLVTIPSLAPITDTTNWYHFAMVVSGSTLYAFLNGALQGTAAYVQQNDNPGTWRSIIGSFGGVWGLHYLGQIDEVRVTKGVARYTANFTPPTAAFPDVGADSFFSNVTSLLHFNGANGSTTFTDQSGKVWTAFGNSQITTTQSRFGGASGSFDGTGDYLSTPNTTDFDFGTGDFTAEAWVRLNVNNSLGYIFSRGNGAGTNGGFAMAVNATGKLLLVHQGIAFQTAGATTLATGQWYHLAICRSGTTVRLFVDGIQDASATNSTNYTAQGSTPTTIGSNFDLNVPKEFLNGFIDDLRITKGVARYTANFTPPVGPFPDAAGGYLYWSPTDKSVQATLSNLNRLVTHQGTTTSWARSATSKSSGKWRVQFVLSPFVTTHGVGFATSASTGSYVGATASAWALWGNYGGSEIRRYNNNAFVSYAASFASNDRIDLLLDIDNGRAWWRRNGVVISGDPVAGTGAMATFTPGTTLFLAADCFGVNGATILRTDPAEMAEGSVAGFTDGWPA